MRYQRESLIRCMEQSKELSFALMETRDMLRLNF